MNTVPRTRLAVLGTVADLHNQPIAYNLASLRQIVTSCSPDLLCAEITSETWESRDLSTAELEIREALVPVEASTDIVLVPVAPSMKRYLDFSPLTLGRLRFVKACQKLLRWGQRLANTPEAIHSLSFEAFCHTICFLTEVVWTKEEKSTWKLENQKMVANILRVIRRDPGCRVLVVVQCQRLHNLTPLLKSYPKELEIVHYQDL